MNTENYLELRVTSRTNLDWLMSRIEYFEMVQKSHIRPTSLAAHSLLAKFLVLYMYYAIMLYF